MTGNAPLLEVADLVMRYELGPGVEPLTVLAGVDLALAAGESVAVVGPRQVVQPGGADGQTENDANYAIGASDICVHVLTSRECCVENLSNETRFQ